MLMEKKQFETLLDSMGITYIHTANRPTAQSHESLGHYNMSGGWVEEDIVIHQEPDGVKIKQIPFDPNCGWCNVVVDKPAEIIAQNKRGKYQEKNWTVKCRTCSKELDFATFMGRKKTRD